MGIIGLFERFGTNASILPKQNKRLLESSVTPRLQEVYSLYYTVWSLRVHGSSF
jgi:hypothetical protein